MKAIIAQSKFLLFFVVMTAACLIILWTAGHGQLYSTSVRGSLFQSLAGTPVYNALHVYFAVCGLIVCAVGLPISLIVTLVTIFSRSARAARKAVRRAAWERKQAAEAEAKAAHAP